MNEINQEHLQILSKVTGRKILIEEELIPLHNALDALKILSQQKDREIEQIKKDRNEANGNIESCYILHRSLEWKLNRANAEIDKLKKPVVIQGQPLRCTHEWESVEPGYTGETARCKKCGIYE